MEQFSSHWEKVFPPHSHSVGSPLTPLSVEHTHLSSPALCEKNNWAAHKHHYPIPPAHTHTLTQDIWIQPALKTSLLIVNPTNHRRRFEIILFSHLCSYHLFIQVTYIHEANWTSDQVCVPSSPPLETIHHHIKQLRLFATQRCNKNNVTMIMEM